MFEIIGLMFALAAMAGVARGRGASPVLTVGAAVIGFFLIDIAGSLLVPSSYAPFAARLCAWGWVGAVAGFVRFVVGSGRPSPTGSWICTNCSFTNAQHANLCEACRQPWAATR